MHQDQGLRGTWKNLLHFCWMRDDCKTQGGSIAHFPRFATTVW
jgi:hypothetical protein